MMLAGFTADNDNIKRKNVDHFLYFPVLRVNKPSKETSSC